jgi:hypothetical protein
MGPVMAQPQEGTGEKSGYVMAGSGLLILSSLGSSCSQGYLGGLLSVPPVQDRH